MKDDDSIEAKAAHASESRGRFARGAYVTAGTLFLGLGIIGIALPVLPTTPFLLLAAFCYSRGSKRFHDWLLNHRLFGRYIGDYLEGRGIPVRTKVFVLSLLWATILISAFFFMKWWVIRLVLLVVAVSVSIHIIGIKTKIRE